MIASGAAIDIPNQMIFDMLAESASRNPDGAAIHFMGHTLKYGQLLGAVKKFMGFLRSKGIQQGDRVGIMLPNCPQYVIAYYAITGIGAVVVQVNPMSTAPELSYLLEDSGMRMLILLDSFLPVLEKMTERHALQDLVVVNLQGGATDSLPTQAVSFMEVLMAASPAEPVKNLSPADTLAVLQYTGGTTGRPKGAMLSHRNIVANAVQSTHTVENGVRPDDITLAALPFFHVYAMTVAMNLPLVSGIPLVILPRFSVQDALDAIQNYKITLFPAVPTMYVALAQAVTPGSDILSSLRVCNCGGAPMPVKVLEIFEQVTGATVLEGYGLSEASPVTHSNPSLASRKIGSIGKLIPGTSAKIVNPDNPAEEVPVGSEGELAIAGPQVMLGYWQRPEETAAVLLDGWLLTGDIATMDEDGFFSIVDRKKDMIIASGYNVYPREVEEALYRHPAILEAAVIGVEDDYRGETVKAYVVLRPGMSVSEEELHAFCREQLAAYKVPRSFEFRDSLPKSAVGKVLRRALKS
ncbi:long-chain fatty acid--CoA ligase [Alicyclobacillus sp. TC]|uniref:long-chain-fatty-acid--CoA ligase n=1 Tax=Alicyclobacillus sp. TC TaxID=2606450 RepID=UPI0019320E17|nr:long-chain fatty acid--CoA ligase [Alicyclobacillus sp. TC]QRF22674.1 long-chain fatty acid--CoA ligase [Alicyclobacillus sp. TC]